MRVAVAESRGEPVARDRQLLQAVRRLTEANPMLGLRGARLGLVMPRLFQMQARATLEAAAELGKAGALPRVEIMIPLVGAVEELAAIRGDIIGVARDVWSQTGANSDLAYSSERRTVMCRWAAE